MLILLQVLGSVCWSIILMKRGDVVFLDEATDPFLHTSEGTVRWLPLLPCLTVSAWLQVDEAWEALNTVAVRSGTIGDAINLDELDLFAVLGLELVDYLVPRGHELHAVTAVRHEKVDDDNRVTASCVDLVLELDVIVGHDALGLFPPVAHFVVFDSY